jgi:hypothetical protein
MVTSLGLDHARVTIAPLRELQEIATTITSALCHRDRLTAADVESLAEPYTDVLPELATVLNSPVVATSFGPP